MTTPGIPDASRHADRHADHRLEAGGSLLRDLLYCVIGPIWVLAAVYKRLGIPV